MLETSAVIAFAASADLRQARVFYEQALGLRVIEQNDFACVFDANGTMLRVTAVAEVARPGYTVLGWRVVRYRGDRARPHRTGRSVPSLCRHGPKMRTVSR